MRCEGFLESNSELCAPQDELLCVQECIPSLRVGSKGRKRCFEMLVLNLDDGSLVTIRMYVCGMEKGR